MTPEEQEQLRSLCEKIAKETDHKRFTELTLELSYLLEKSRDGLKSKGSGTEES